MKRFIVMTVLVGVICCVLSGTVVGNPLDTSGGGPEQLHLAITNPSLKFAGGHPNFDIHLTGTAIFYPPNNPGWPKKVLLVTAFGEYDYDTGIAKERIYATILKTEAQVPYFPDDPTCSDVVLQCSHNPWVHGKKFGAQGCQVTELKKDILFSKMMEKGFCMSSLEYPLSSFLTHDQIRSVLIAWEENMLSEPELDDWNPYSPNEGTYKLTIVSPTSYEVIPDTAASFQLALQNTQPSPPKTIEMRWNRLEDTGGWIGDIKVPGNGKMFLPFAGPTYASWSEFPLTIPLSPAFSSTEPMLYQVGARGEGETIWTYWRHFWIGEPPVNYSAAKLMVKDATKNTQYVYDTFYKFALKQEKALSKTEKAKKPVAKKLNAPEILSPTQNLDFTVSTAPVNIKVEAKHDPGYDIVFEFEHRTSTRSAYKKVNVKLLKLRGLKETTAVEFSTKETGQWRVRTKLDTPGAPWSIWREFNVKRGALR